MVLALAVGSSRVSTTTPSSPRSYFTAESVMSCSFTDLSCGAVRLTGSRHALRSHQLDDRGDAHAAADAQRGQAALELTTLELVDQGAEDHRAGGAERVAHGDRATVDVGDLRGDVHVPHEAHRHRGEGLVDLEQ